MNERLSQINEQLRELAGQQAEARGLEVRLNDLRAQYEERQARVEETARRFREEQEDVDRLERGGLRAFLMNLTGDKEERLSRERRAALAAKCQYDQATSDLDELDRSIRELLRRREQLRTDGAKLEALRREKAELLKQEGGAGGARLAELDRALERTESQHREVAEALRAGRQAEVALSAVLNSLDSAEEWGLVDMMGGGLVTTMFKHEHLGDARLGIDRAQQALSRFRTELADVRELEIPQIRIGEFATFADYFFDGLFADWCVQSGIRDAQNGVSEAHVRVLAALRRLEAAEAELDGQLRTLTGEREELLTRM